MNKFFRFCFVLALCIVTGSGVFTLHAEEDEKMMPAVQELDNVLSAPGQAMPGEEAPAAATAPAAEKKLSLAALATAPVAAELAQRPSSAPTAISAAPVATPPAVSATATPSANGAEPTAAEIRQTPGDKWWIPLKPYDLWKREHLEAWIKKLEDFKLELAGKNENYETINSVDKEIEKAKKILARIISF